MLFPIKAQFMKPKIDSSPTTFSKIILNGLKVKLSKASFATAKKYKYESFIFSAWFLILFIAELESEFANSIEENILLIKSELSLISLLQSLILYLPAI